MKARRNFGVVSSWGRSVIKSELVQRMAARNPRTGDKVPVTEKLAPFFKTGKEMRERLNRAAAEQV